MSFLDPRTIIMLTGVMAGLMSVVLYLMRRSYPPSIRGLGEWSAAVFVLFLAGVLTATRGKAMEDVSVTLANGLVFSGIYMCYVGTQRFLGVRSHLVAGWFTVGLVFAVSAWFTLVEKDYATRLGFSTALQTGLFAVHAHLVYRHASRTFARVLMICVLLAATAVQIMRFAGTLTTPSITGILDASPIQVIYITAYAFIMLLFTISLVLMSTERLREELEHLATHDSLTDAFTRRHMNEAIEQELERCRRQGRDMSLLAMDLDHFKSINDTYGHQAGDRVLIEFVADVRTLLRRHDQLGRFGGEEFIVLLPETPANTALLIAERIRAMMATRKSGCTVSIGVTSRLHDSDTVDALLARADGAMYRAKANGRDRVEAG
jgi:diguanylate cyclase (GGDEF)-like protein